MFHQARLHRPHAFPRTFGVAWLVLLSLLLGTVLVFYSSRHGAVATGSLTHLLPKDPVSREEILSIARSYAEHHWQATSKFKSKHQTHRPGLRKPGNGTSMRRISDCPINGAASILRRASMRA